MDEVETAGVASEAMSAGLSADGTSEAVASEAAAEAVLFFEPLVDEVTRSCGFGGCRVVTALGSTVIKSPGFKRMFGSDTCNMKSNHQIVNE